MAEFKDVAKELERMCNTYHAARKCNTDKCPIYCEDLCYAPAMVHVHGDDACKLEKVVMSWAAEHPEPKYPTFAEWLNSIGVIIGDVPLPLPNIPVYVYQAGAKMFEPIPSDIAEKLGIEPKEV